MLYVYFGNDTDAVRRRAFKTLDSLGEGASAGTTRLTVDTYTSGMLADVAGSTSLFDEPQIVVLDIAVSGFAHIVDYRGARPAFGFFDEVVAIDAFASEHMREVPRDA